VDGDVITIRIPIQFSGDGATPDVRQRYASAIESGWTGKFGKYEVTTTVDTESGVGDRNETNKIKIMNDAKYRSYVLGSNRGKWNNSGNQDMVRHEAGHLMGQPDRYTDQEQPDGKIISVPNHGYERNIMGNMAAPPSEQDIQDIIRNTKVNKIIVVPKKNGQ
jgi:hypothetical protein